MWYAGMATNGDQISSNFNVLLVGNSGVGKSCLMQRYCDGYFPSRTFITVGADLRAKCYQVGKRKIFFRFWDLFQSMSLPNHFYSRASGVMVIFDTTCECSFDDMKKWMELIEKHAPSGIPVMILGNKCDLKNCRVTWERGNMLAANYGAMFMEVSAKTGHNVERAFASLARKMVPMEIKSVADLHVLDSSNETGLLQPMRLYQIGILGNALDIVEMGKRASVMLGIFDRNQPCSLPTSAVETRLVCCSNNEETSCGVSELEQGRYEIAYQPTFPGLHVMEVKVRGRPVKGSPFAVRVLRSLDTPQRMIEGLNGPRGVAVNSRGELIVSLVSEAGIRGVSIFSSTGEKMRTLEEKICNSEPPGIMHGVAVDKSDNILVLDNDSCLLRVFSCEGEELKAVDHLRSGGQLSCLSGICVNRETGLVYVVDRSAQCVHILARDLSKSIRKFGKAGRENGQFDSPCDIAYDSIGDVYVSDTGNHRVQVFTPEGCYLRQFGKKGSDPGDLQGPIGICIDSADLVYVGELHGKRISVFKTDGEWIKCFGCEGNGPGQFDRVFGMTVDHCGVLYVSDYGNNRVVIV